MVDVSGSMTGTPLGMAKRAMRLAIEKLRPVDTFNIITFAGTTAQAFPSPRPANRLFVDQALGFLERGRAGGGTYMASGVEAALRPEVEQGRHRYVFFLTDGFVGNEAGIISGSRQLVEGLRERGQRARVFGFGVGSSPNRQLLEGLSEAGEGVAVYATNREDPALGVNKFFHYLDRVVLTDVRVHWADATQSEHYPDPVPDLYASHPILVHGRYRRLGDAPIHITARAGERELSLPVQVKTSAAPGPKGGVIGALWARAKVAHLEEESWLGMMPNAPEAITRLGLDFALVTPYTSFVAVDESRIVENAGKGWTISQPVETPEGVDPVAAGGRTTPMSPVTGLPGPAKSPSPTVIPTPAPEPPPMEVSEEPMRYSPAGDTMAADEPSPRGGAPSPNAPDLAVHDFRGCGCRVATRASDHGLWLLGLGLALVILRRRRAL